MAAELAVIDILRNDVTLGALIGTGTNAKIYPYEIPQKAVFPVVSVSMDDINPSDTKDGVSTLDIEFIRVECMDTKLKNTADSSGSYHMAEAVRTALDRTSGTFSSVVVQSIRFEGASAYVSEINNKVVYINELTFKVRVRRI